MVADVTFDSEGTIWIAATGEGVFSYRFDTCKLTNYRQVAFAILRYIVHIVIAETVRVGGIMAVVCQFAGRCV